MEPEPKDIHTRFYEIDLLRFLAAILVVIYHYTFIVYNLSNLSPVRYEYFEPITKYFYLGVELFFVISGYVVLMSAYKKTLKQFLISRITRLYPAFWVACTLTFIIILFFGPTLQSLAWSENMHVTKMQYIVNMTMLQHFLGYSDIDGAYWTLATEINFYFLISLLMSYKIFKEIDIFILIWIIYTGAAQLSAATDTPFHYLLIPEYSSFFIAGMLFYVLQNNLMPLWKIYGLLIASFILCVRSAWIEAQVHTRVFHQPHSVTIVALVIAFIFVFFWLIVKRKIDMSRFPWLNRLGAITYPLYLLHSNIGYILFQKINYSVNKYFLLISIIGLMLVASYLVHVFIEKRFSSLLGKQMNKLLLYLSS
ncbi:acyltransferase family protein [Hymenobacter psoromatis]|uniref:acyltransferase family protein n=1 Tax=Hymenobacter psoromatis TaxID=1484116 RepID=UPI001CC030B8|nr:acyltransferase [Hymenobacter psoromatis]